MEGVVITCWDFPAAVLGISFSFDEDCGLLFVSEEVVGTWENREGTGWGELFAISGKFRLMGAWWLGTFADGGVVDACCFWVYRDGGGWVTLLASSGDFRLLVVWVIGAFVAVEEVVDKTVFLPSTENAFGCSGVTDRGLSPVEVAWLCPRLLDEANCNFGDACVTGEELADFEADERFLSSSFTLRSRLRSPAGETDRSLFNEPPPEIFGPKRACMLGFSGLGPRRDLIQVEGSGPSLSSRLFRERSRLVLGEWDLRDVVSSTLGPRRFSRRPREGSFSERLTSGEVVIGECKAGP